MSDDLFERLRAVDPATEERIAQEGRALGNTPARIVESEPSNVRRFPKVARRKATLAAVAAVVVVAIALPLTLLRSLGDGEPSPPGNDPTDWVTVGTLAEIEGAHVTFLQQVGAFVIASPGVAPYALRVGTGAGVTPTPIGLRPVGGQRALYCRATERFSDPRGNVFGEHGAHLSGPDPEGLPLLETRVINGLVQIDPAHPVAEVRSSDDSVQLDADCLTANGVPLEGDPGFAIPAGTELPPIAVGLPQRDMFVQSPITIMGSADVFEATVNIRVLNGNGEVIAETFAMATCGTGCRGDFSTQIDVPIDAEQPGTIQVFEYSAKDGSMINVVEIPVTLVPPGSSETASLEGTWFDGNDQPLPNGSPVAAGNVLNVYRGAEHCQWESVTFVNIGWPVGTLSNAQGDWRQYVRDPLGRFDDGALHVGYLSDTSLPSDAADTGYHRGPWRLWVSPSQAEDAVFVVNADTSVVERWGRATPPILCD